MCRIDMNLNVENHDVSKPFWAAQSKHGSSFMTGSDEKDVFVCKSTGESDFVGRVPCGFDVFPDFLNRLLEKNVPGPIQVIFNLHGLNNRSGFQTTERIVKETTSVSYAENRRIREGSLQASEVFIRKNFCGKGWFEVRNELKDCPETNGDVVKNGFHDFSILAMIL